MVPGPAVVSFPTAFWRDVGRICPHQFPLYQKHFSDQLPVRPITFLTFDTCQRPPRAVRMPRLLRAIATPRKLLMPERRMASMMGRTVAAKRSASAIETVRPRAAAL